MTRSRVKQFTKPINADTVVQVCVLTLERIVALNTSVERCRDIEQRKGDYC